MARHLFPVDVRRQPERSRAELQDGARNVDLHPLAHRNGLRLLFRLVRAPVAGNSEARRAVVLEESERSGFQSDPGNDPFAHSEAHTEVSRYCDLTDCEPNIMYVCVLMIKTSTRAEVEFGRWIESGSITWQ